MAASTSALRLFVAVRPSAAALDDLERAVIGIGTSAPGVRWQARERWHLTLAFLGDVDEVRVPGLVERLHRSAARHDPVGPLRLSGAGTFGRRVLWLGVSAGGGDDVAAAGRHAADPVLALRRLAESVQAGMRRAGVALEERPWRPHLTLARFRDGDPDPRPLARVLADYHGPDWTLDTVHLVRSRLGPHPAYEDLAVVPLGRHG